MPLPVRLNYVDADGVPRDVAVKPGSPAPAPTPEYHPTYRVVRCFGCKSVGIAEFVNGFDLKAADRLMDGKPIRGVCFRCNGETDLIPLPVNDATRREFRLYYDIQRSLEAAVARGERMPAGALVVHPLARVEEYERAKAGSAGR